MADGHDGQEPHHGERRARAHARAEPVGSSTPAPA
jgi:hypothetical protein